MLECYALEKIHGTSAHVSYRQGILTFFAGGEDHQRFIQLFDESSLKEKMAEKFLESDDLVIYGEAFGGKQQGMLETYGKNLRFLAFDVKLNGCWLDVPSAEGLASELGIGFVPYERGPLTLVWLDEQRNRPSLVAVVPDKMREGVVIRPIHELQHKDGSRVIAKHKRPEFRETKTERKVDPEQAVVWAEAEAIAEEWVTPMRLEHVLQKTPYNNVKDTGSVIRAMQEDVEREGSGEFVWSKDVGRAVAKTTLKLLQDFLRK